MGDTTAVHLVFPPEEGFSWSVVGSQWSLCPECLDLLSTRVEDYGNGHGEYWSWLSELQASAEAGCSFCEAVCRAFTTICNSKSSEDATGPSLRIRLKTPCAVEVGDPDSSDWAWITMSRDEANTSMLNPELTLSREWISFIRRQLRNCLSNQFHDCGPKPDPKTPPQWPRRILKITNSITLVDFDSQTMAGEYAAVSYSWGERSVLERRPPLRALASTLQELRSGIPASRLPLTLQQATRVCEHLGIGYIWIDSLCIIQDSPGGRDWETEATKMETVYAMSKVTIIAGSSTSCHSGFFDVEKPITVLGATVRSPIQLHARPMNESGFHAIDDRADPLDQRGWTYQEEILSTRYIKFTKNDIQWKCNAGTTCLCGQSLGMDDMINWDGSVQDSVIETWETIVGNFSQRIFTVDADKLLALSGVARKMAPYFGFPGKKPSYFAGIWLGSEQGSAAYPYDIAQLVWSRFETGRLCENYVAPSISWASINGNSPVLFGVSPSEFALSRITGSSRQLMIEGLDFGRVSAGSLTLRGPLIPCWIYGQNSDKPQVKLEREIRPKMKIHRVSFDCPVAQYPLPDGSRTIQRARESKPFDKTAAKILLMVLGGRDPATLIGVRGIVLGRQPDTAGYQRLGFIDLGSDTWHRWTPEDFKAYETEVTLY
ncbi:hypothetical protein MFIFM68171_10232 [Madurella fahalii]|uniref:Heterokaryon incompatibility domain-containing protein n=1 Tax=Madurella fahalii TaxID=1157608 RepID=A0ABQ0GQM0_9PEZI